LKAAAAVEVARDAEAGAPAVDQAWIDFSASASRSSAVQERRRRVGPPYRESA
jgi:hypothetical protein